MKEFQKKVSSINQLTVLENVHSACNRIFQAFKNNKNNKNNYNYNNNKNNYNNYNNYNKYLYLNKNFIIQM